MKPQCMELHHNNKINETWSFINLSRSRRLPLVVLSSLVVSVSKWVSGFLRDFVHNLYFRLWLRNANSTLWRQQNANYPLNVLTSIGVVNGGLVSFPTSRSLVQIGSVSVAGVSQTVATVAAIGSMVGGGGVQSRHGMDQRSGMD